LKKEIVKITVICLIVLSGYVVMALHWEALKPYRGEDRLIEYLGAIFFFIASILFFACYWLSSQRGKDTPHLHSKRNKFYVFLAVLFFIGCGEEISWGQRIFGWQSPKIVQEMNGQRETNFHNIEIFNDQRYRRGNPLENERRPISSLLLDVDTWFFLFWFSYCLILPLVNRNSLRASRKFSQWGLPVPPLWIGSLLLVNFSLYAIPHLTWFLSHMDHDFNELKESYDGFLFAVLAHHELMKQLSLKKRAAPPEGEMQEV
jgi:hypothetical protein